MTGFSAPGDHVVLLEGILGAAEEGDARSEAQAAVERMGRTTRLATRPDATTEAGTTSPATDVGDLVVTTVSPHTVVDDQLGSVCARRLRPSGVLVVLTHTATVNGRLVDPTGALVTACQHADLLYLQHIVTLHTDRPPRSSADDHGHAQQQHETSRPWIRRHPRIHGDLVVFTPSHTTTGPR